MLIGIHVVNKKCVKQEGRGIYLNESEFDALNKYLGEMYTAINEYQYHRDLFHPNQKLLIKKLPLSATVETSQYKWEKNLL